MTGHRFPLWFALAVISLLFPELAVANDSEGFQGTTGIELSATDDIRMVSEDLRIASEEIAVSYVFRNVTAHPVETMVVFPLPDLDLSQGLTAPNWDFPARSQDFLNFRLWIDGRPATPALERRAFHLGKDVTHMLEAAGAIDMVPWKEADYDQQAKSLSASALAELRSAGLLAQGEYDNTPQWVLQTRYFWRQSYPVGTDVRVRHVYKPFVGHALIDRTSDINGRTVVGRFVGPDINQGGDRYCLDERTRSAVAAAQHRSPESSIPFDAAEIEYILMTARNWRGPIDTFHLTLDKGAADNMISLCWNGLKKTGATTFESTITRFVPTHDIRLLIFRPSSSR